jgi:hypothetical protein
VKLSPVKKVVELVKAEQAALVQIEEEVFHDKGSIESMWHYEWWIVDYSH